MSEYFSGGIRFESWSSIWLLEVRSTLWNLPILNLRLLWIWIWTWSWRRFWSCRKVCWSSILTSSKQVNLQVDFSVSFRLNCAKELKCWGLVEEERLKVDLKENYETGLMLEGKLRIEERGEVGRGNNVRRWGLGSEEGGIRGKSEWSVIRTKKAKVEIFVGISAWKVHLILQGGLSYKTIYLFTPSLWQRAHLTHQTVPEIHPFLSRFPALSIPDHSHWHSK